MSSIVVKKTLDPTVAVSKDRTYLVKTGASNILLRKESCNTVGNSAIKWNVTTPSTRVSMDRSITVTTRIFLKSSNAPATVINPDAVFSTSTAGLRQWPLHSCIDNMILKLNDNTMSYEPSRCIAALMQYGNNAEDRATFMSGTATKPDITSSYNLGVNDVGINSPFTSYANSVIENSRNFELFIEKLNTNDGYVFTVTEQLMISPMLWGGMKAHGGLYGIQVMELSFAFSNLNRFFSGIAASFATPAGAGVNSLFLGSPNDLVVSLDPSTSAHTLNIRFLAPPVDYPLGDVFHYPYFGVRRFTQLAPVVSPIVPRTGGALQTINMNSITLNEIFKRFYVWVAPVQSPTDFTSSVEQANYYARIDKINLTFNTQSGIFSDFNSYDLYRRSATNGLDRTFKAFNKYLGSVVCIESAKDLYFTNPYDASGVRGNYQFQISIDFTDLRAEGAPAIQYEATLLFIDDGVLTVSNSLVSYNTGTLTQEDVKQAEDVSVKVIEQSGIYAGGSWSGFKDWLSGAYKTVKGVVEQAIPIVRDISGAVSGVASMIPHPKAQAVGAISGTINKGLGGRSSGGRRMRTSSLAHRM
jgi:hypothetical protein